MPTTIYFSGSITGGRDDVDFYVRIVERLVEMGHRVLSGGVTAAAIGASGEALDARSIFDRDMTWIEQVAREGGVLVAEVSKPSTGVGYEIAAARYLHRMPVICLYRPAYTTRCTAMVAGDPGIRTIEYALDGFDEMLDELARVVGE